MAQIKQNNQVITPIDTADANAKIDVGLLNYRSSASLGVGRTGADDAFTSRVTRLIFGVNTLTDEEVANINAGDTITVIKMSGNVNVGVVATYTVASASRGGSGNFRGIVTIQTPTSTNEIRPTARQADGDTYYVTITSPPPTTPTATIVLDIGTQTLVDTASLAGSTPNSFHSFGNTQLFFNPTTITSTQWALLMVGDTITFTKKTGTGAGAVTTNTIRSISNTLNSGARELRLAERPSFLIGLAVGDTFDIVFSRAPAAPPPTESRVKQVWTKPDGYINPSFIDKAGLGIEQTFTRAEKTKLEGIQDSAEVNVQSDFTERVDTEDDFMANKPIKDDLNFYWNLVPEGTTFQNTVADQWTLLQNSNTPFITYAAGGFPVIAETSKDDPRKSAILSADTAKERLTDATTGVDDRFRLTGFNGYEDSNGNFRVIDPKYMLYISFGNWLELIPLSLFQFLELTAVSLVGETETTVGHYPVGTTRGTDYLSISVGDDELKIGRTADFNILVNQSTLNTDIPITIYYQ